MSQQPAALRLHLTNVAGAGATQLLKSLLPALERDPLARISAMHLPDRGELANYQTQDSRVSVQRYRRWLPNALSRLLECTWLGHRFDGTEPLLVLGDLPLRCNAPQTVFVQTSHLTVPATGRWAPDRLRYVAARWVLRRNARHVKAFIVQSAVMQQALISSYPAIANRTHVIAQPVPAWLLDANLTRRGRQVALDAPLDLIYPAAMYPHKNHRLLRQLGTGSAATWPVARLTLTIAPEQSPSSGVPWLHCSGFLSADRMIELYERSDALLFLSTDESYGFPLVEAMFVGLPVICPDLPYARELCGDGAIYFDPHSIESLRAAVSSLHQRLGTGWWPDWSKQLAAIPSSWQAVAHAMLMIATSDVACVLPPVGAADVGVGCAQQSPTEQSEARDAN